LQYQTDIVGLFQQNQKRMKNILITTQHRGVFFAQIEEEQLIDYKTGAAQDPKAPRHLIDLKNCRMAIYFNTTKGVMELAEVGPNKGSRIGATADVDIMHDVTAIFSVTEKAAEAWRTA
jgi:hypothetical protein